MARDDDNKEPVLTLRASDRFAPELAEAWAALLEAHYDGRRGGMPPEVADQVCEAKSTAMRMRRWKPAKPAKESTTA